MLLDLQVHSREGSPDSILTVDEIIAECLDTRIDGVALTEHLPSDYPLDRFADHGLVAIPAREIACAGAHLLVLSQDRSWLTSLPRLIEPAGLSAPPDSVVIWAHPGATSGSGAYPPFVGDPLPLKDVVGAVEILNGKHLHFGSVIAAAEKLARSLGVARTAGSDAHRPGEVGRCVTGVAAPVGSDLGEVLGAIKRDTVEPLLNSGWMKKRSFEYREDLKAFVR